MYALEFSSKIKKLRTAKGLTQKQIADYLNVSQNAIYNWENGKREPNMDMQKKIAKFFDFPLYLLLDDNFELENVELEMKRARPVNAYEMAEPPKPFTAPLSQYKHDSIYIDPNLQKLYEVAMQKALRHEELTKEEEQVIIGIPGQLRQKSDSYEDSHSFASSEEELNKILKQRQKQREELLLNDYRKLNELGQLEAKKRVSELTELLRYTKPDELPQD